jgi:hypothetical protein
MKGRSGDPATKGQVAYYEEINLYWIAQIIGLCGKSILGIAKGNCGHGGN